MSNSPAPATAAAAGIVIPIQCCMILPVSPFPKDFPLFLLLRTNFVFYIMVRDFFPPRIHLGSSLIMYTAKTIIKQMQLSLNPDSHRSQRIQNTRPEEERIRIGTYVLQQTENWCIVYTIYVLHALHYFVPTLAIIWGYNKYVGPPNSVIYILYLYIYTHQTVIIFLPDRTFRVLLI